MATVQHHQPAVDEAPLKYQTIGNLLHNRATEFPDEVFLIDGKSGRELTYAQVNARANRIANGLAELGIESSDRIATIHTDALTTSIVLFGCAKLGAVFSPVNPNFRGESLRYQLDDVNPAGLVLQQNLVEHVDAVLDSCLIEPTVVIDDPRSAEDARTLDSRLIPETARLADVRQSAPTEPDVSVDWNDDAWVMYTSGTTGMPKGVVLPHRWITANHAGQTSLLLDSTDVTHCPLPLYHITAASYLLCSTLIASGSIVLWGKFSASAFWDRVSEYGVTFACLIDVMVPGAVQNLPADGTKYRTLNKAMMGPLTDDFETVTERMGIDLLHTLYGQTESGLPITGMIRMETNSRGDQHGKSVNAVVATAEEYGIPVRSPDVDSSYCGEPVDDLFEVTILNEDDEKIPPGEVGQLAVRPKIPDVLFDHYNDNYGKTLEDIRNLWFHTGDFARRDKFSNYYFVGRMGDVIRRRGENITPLQVEQIIGDLEGVADVAVFPIPAESSEEDAVGTAVKTVDRTPIEASDIRAQMREQAPEYMLPDKIWFVDEFPHTDTNKVQKSRLKDELIDS